MALPLTHLHLHTADLKGSVAFTVADPDAVRIEIYYDPALARG